MAATHNRQSSIDLDSADRPFDNIINFRDVGRTINQLLGRRVLKEGLLYRSARLDDASERDKRRLEEEYHISTIIDLRSSTEHHMAATKHLSESETPTHAFCNAASDDTEIVSAAAPTTSSSAASAAAVTTTTTATANPDNIHLVDLPHAQRHLVSLTGRAFERTLLWRLDWWNFLKVIALAASGYRTDAVIIVGQQVMSPRGLIGLGIDTLDSSFGEMKEIFEVLAGGGETSVSLDHSTSNGSTSSSNAASPYPVIVHCTQGKDRTGLIILLLLLLTGTVPQNAIRADYVLSEGELVVEAEERMKEIRMLGLSEDYTKCPEGFTAQICAHLESRYGGVSGYLKQVGIDEVKLERIRKNLLA
ncbi:putative tyrosine/serine protein phosphatase [Aspergillus saccharolyticus JOP 1030-1]|uniref:Putative tyrosine/serine protein phosphatase n=1 Tax=Aspergillus saccharolyticus JOP 1030-1 TaxID=1450539 RepID=A0A318YYM8_9EURO|nr:putative tyrosine/serine protein phosphatase [Aspergillus saccharolyticus JOP 1030-1]PYH40065.1 putative tyrosine/serine protein phosphatase [Aspergillus saccharolyticus JOP 1030-1]